VFQCVVCLLTRLFWWLSLSQPASSFLCSFSVPNLPSEVWTTCFVSLPPRSLIITGRSIARAVASVRVSVLIMFRAFGTSPAESSPSTGDFYHPWGISFFSSKGESLAVRNTLCLLNVPPPGVEKATVCLV
jgi:hypothetical protein